ncbi:MAG: hypothetical protein HXX12_10225 [Geothrix sp.]|uniref:kelch repeat-containing protein n=1 Tax=Geothrix sp. TaxID=1962974 RepID=UPI0017FD669E|nr:kelch repeat-containing protein [Geothrix sp.]NWJ41336.1 hypothetical protein [Geothrix sp.]WIL20676.1 MAG: hypothetical protein QOZ81_003259 [Geothrix sp.]
MFTLDGNPGKSAKFLSREVPMYGIRAFRQALGGASVLILLCCGGGGTPKTVEAPKITAQPLAQTVPITSTASLTVAVSGSPTPTLQWQRQERGSWHDLAGATGLTHTFATTVRDHLAAFRVRVSNEGGSVLSNPVQVTLTKTYQGVMTPLTASTTALMGHTATRLASGKVLLAGGYLTGTEKATNLFDPATGLLTPGPTLLTPRWTHAAVLLDSGKVLLLSGTTTGYAKTPTCELYDPDTGTISPAGSLLVGRWGFTATLLPNGKILIAGGFDSNNSIVASCELYDPATFQSTLAQPMATGRENHAANLLGNGKVLVTGGLRPTPDVDGYAFPLASTELYDPATGQWTAGPDMADGREYHTTTLLENGQLLVYSGWTKVGYQSFGALRSIELYDPVTGAFRKLPNPLGGSAIITNITCLIGGKVLLPIGCNDLTGLQDALFDPATETFSRSGRSLFYDEYLTHTLLLDGRVLVVGRDSNFASMAAVYN